jgi:hypothetical protein
MKNKLVLVLIFSFLFTQSIFANCLPNIENKIEQTKEHLLFSKKKEKKIVKVTAISVGGVGTAFWGTMFVLITDGATIPAAALVGTGFGAIMAGGAVATIAIPMITYNQIIKGHIRSLNKTKKLLEASETLDYQNKLIQKLFRKVRRSRSSLTVEAMVDQINDANSKAIFCESDKKISNLRMIKNYLKNITIL